MKSFLLQIIIAITFLRAKELPRTCEKSIKHFQNNYTCLSLGDSYLGMGSNAITFIIIKNHFNMKYVLKVSQPRSHSLSENKNFIYTEKLKNVKYIIKRHGYKQGKFFFYEILDYGENGSLDNFLQPKETLELQRPVLKLFAKIIEGIDGMHKAKIIHADIKDENVVIDKMGDPLIIDFDLSVDDGVSTGGRGTKEYMDPNIIANWGVQRTTYTPAVDKWSLGILLYKMVFKYLPFNRFLGNYDKEEILDFIKKGDVLFPKGTSYPIMDCVIRLLRIRDEERIPLSRLMANIKRFMNEESWEYTDREFTFNINGKLPKSIKQMMLDESEEDFSSSFLLYFIIGIFFIVLSSIGFYLVKRKGNKNEVEEERTESSLKMLN